LGPLVAGKVMDLLVPSSARVEALGSQVVGGVRAAECSKVKSAVVAEGQETVRSDVTQHGQRRKGR